MGICVYWPSDNSTLLVSPGSFRKRGSQENASLKSSHGQACGAFSELMTAVGGPIPQGLVQPRMGGPGCMEEAAG